ncbi:MAG: TolC family protein, partial [Melioribacteraceae bacterium]|nr:TolC family protein [Melioribacteraceae bacterium]
NRDEIYQLNIAIETADDTKGLSEASYFPGISLAADYGFQGEEYKFGKDDDFWMASLVLNWNLFNGFQDLSKSEKAEIEIKNLKTKVEELKDLIKLQTKEAYKNYQVASKTIDAADERLEAYKKSFRIINKKFYEGLATQLEYLDAQNKLTQGEITKIISEYNLQQSYAELEKIIASIDLTKYELEKK